MTHKSAYDELRDTALRRPLDAAEEARLRTHFLLHPEDQPRWEADMALEHALDSLPNAPLASNFTAQVLAAVDRNDRCAISPARSPGWLAWLHHLRWTHATATAAVLLAVALLAQQQLRRHSHAKLASDLKEVSSVARLPSVEMLKDFDAINSLGQASRADLDLLAAFAPEPR